MLKGAALSPAPGTNANYVKLHTDVGDPGSAGTANASSVTARVQVTFGTASGGSLASSGTAPSWPSWAGSTENIKFISVWDASTAGNFLYSAQLTTTKTVTAGDTFTLSSLSVSLSPVAA